MKQISIWLATNAGNEWPVQSQQPIHCDYANKNGEQIIIQSANFPANREWNNWHNGLFKGIMQNASESCNRDDTYGLYADGTGQITMQ